MQAFTELLAKQSASGNRSTVLQPLSWLIGILLTALLASTWAKPPDWVVLLIAALVATAVLIFFVAYIYFGIKNPDALRSERFTLSKMAIEKNLIGDNAAGLIEVAENQRPTVFASLPDQIGKEK